MGKPHTKAPVPPAAASPARYAVLFGLLSGLLLLAFFIYPAGAYPLQALMLTAIMTVAAAGLAAKLLAGGGAGRAAFLSALGGLPALGGLLFIIWAVVRWRMAEVPALGHEWIVALLALGVALTLGCGVGVLDRTEPVPGTTAFTTLTRLIVLGAIAFGLFSLYQYFIDYPRALAELESLLDGPARDLRKEGLLHALRQRRVAGQLGNANLFAAQMALFALIALGAAGRESSRLGRGLGWAGVGAAAVAVLMSLSRGGLLTLMLALAWGGTLLLLGRRGKGLDPKAVALVTCLALAAAGARDALAASESLVQRLGNMTTVRERLYYWEIALKVWARHPLIGEGPGGFSLLYLTFKAPIARESQFAHSWIFQVGAELGGVGLGLLWMFWGGAVARVLGRHRRGDLHPDVPWCLAALLLLGFNGLFEFSFQWQSFLVAAGLLGGMVSGLTAVPAATPGGRMRGWVALALAAAVAVLGAIHGPPHYLAAHDRWRGEVAAEDGDWPEAARAYAAAVRRLPDDPGARVAYAGALGQLGQAPAAWMQLETAARLNPSSAAIRNAQARWMEGQGRREEALGKMAEVIARYPSNVAYRLDRARMLLEAERAGEARADLLTIEREGLPVWDFQKDTYNELRAAAGLARLPREKIPD